MRRRGGVVCLATLAVLHSPTWTAVIVPANNTNVTCNLVQACEVCSVPVYDLEIEAGATVGGVQGIDCVCSKVGVGVATNTPHSY